MSLVSAVFGKKFISIVSDGLATDNNGNIISSHFDKFKVYNGNFVFAAAGSSVLFDHIFDDVENDLRKYGQEIVMKRLSNDISKMESTPETPSITIMAFSIDYKGVKGIIQHNAQPVSKMTIPEGNDLNYFIVGPGDKSTKEFENEFLRILSTKDSMNIQTIKDAQIELNNSVSDKYPNSVNKKTKTFTKIV